MATQQAPPPSQQQNRDAVLAALVVVLLARNSESDTGVHVAALLEPLGIARDSALIALALLHPHVPPLPPEVAQRTATGFVARTETPRAAAFLYDSAARLSAGGSTDAERRYIAQHLQARQMRSTMARRVDAASRLFGPVLGWRAVMDKLTTPACRAAHGSNFHFASPPAIGYPGTLHGGSCRCLPGPPFPGAVSVDRATVGVGTV